MLNIADTLTAIAASRPSQVAIIDARKNLWRGPRHVEVSYAALEYETRVRAAALRRVGLADGARVVIMAPPSKNFFVTTFALFRAGAVPVFIDPGMGMRSLASCIERASPHGFIGTTKALVARRLFARRETGDATALHIDGEDWGGRDAHYGNGSLDGQRSDAAAILFTSGSTGHPKGAVYTHENFFAQIEALRTAFAIEPGEIDLCTFPLFQLFAPALGMTAVIPDMDFTSPAAADPASLARLANQHACTNFFGSPALIDRLSEYANARSLTLPSLKRIISAGAPVNPRITAQAQAMLSGSAQIFTPYGATEALPLAIIGGREVVNDTMKASARGLGLCIGRPAPNTEIRVMRIDDSPVEAWNEAYALPQGEVGEIVVSGRQVTSRYFRDPDADASHKIADPSMGRVLHRTGDLGYLDQSGRLWFCGRKAHRIDTTSESLFTVRIEGIFNAHPAVRRSALVRVNTRSVPEPWLVVEPRQRLNASQRATLERDLVALRDRYGANDAVLKFHFSRRLPVDRRHNAKIQVEELAASLEQS